MVEVAKEDLARSKDGNEEYYDKKSKAVKFQANDLVFT